MILDLDRVEPHRTARRAIWLYPVVTCLLVIAFAGVALYGPVYQRPGPPAPAAPIDRSAALAARAAADSPDLPRILALPDADYLRVTRVALSGSTGLNATFAHPNGRELRYVLRGGRDVTVSQLPAGSSGVSLLLTVDGQPMTVAIGAVPASVSSPPVSVRGASGLAFRRDRWAVLAWAEGAVRYEMRSLTLTTDELARLADRLR